MHVVSLPPASRALLALLAVVTSTAGCATKGDLRNVQVEIRSLSERTDSLWAELVRQRRISVDSLGRQGERLTDLQGRFLQELRNISTSLDQIAQLTRQNSSDIAALNEQMALMGRGAAGPPGALRGGGAEPVSTLDPQDAYRAAEEQARQRNYRAAEHGFEQFLNQFPNHDLAASALFELAEIRFQQALYDDAIERFLRIQEEHPEHPRVPEALYRVALIHIELDDEDQARRYLGLVINTYEDSAWARRARQRLRELGG